jgi:hypothetical protein
MRDGVNCCWPGQAWVSSSGTCVGVPSCPSGFVAEGDASCVSSAALAARQSAVQGVSMVVIDTMIKSNRGVKSCFVAEKGNSGDVPRGVKVKLTIQPSGKVSSASIPSGDWAGTDFDSCLSGAVMSIPFSPFEGDSVTTTYSFNL